MLLVEPGDREARFSKETKPMQVEREDLCGLKGLCLLDTRDAEGKSVWGASEQDEAVVMALEQGLDPAGSPQTRGRPRGSFPAL